MIECKTKEKQYIEIPYGHWSLDPKFYKLWSKTVADWVDQTTQINFYNH